MADGSGAWYLYDAGYHQYLIKEPYLKRNKAFRGERPYSLYEAKQFFFISEPALSDFSLS